MGDRSERGGGRRFKELYFKIYTYKYIINLLFNQKTELHPHYIFIYIYIMITHQVLIFFVYHTLFDAFLYFRFYSKSFTIFCTNFALHDLVHRKLFYFAISHWFSEDLGFNRLPRILFIFNLKTTKACKLELEFTSYITSFRGTNISGNIHCTCIAHCTIAQNQE